MSAMRKLLSPGVFGGALFLLLIFQVFYFYHTSRSLATSHSPTTCAGAVPSSVQDDLPCHQLDEAHCQLRSSECYPIRGERCGGTAGESEFLECVTNYQAVQTSKMELDPPLPTWGYGHSDMKHICAFPEEGPHARQVFRFDKIAPSNWKQVKCFKCEIHPPALAQNKGKTGLTLLALVHKEFDSFQNSLKSWKSSGLLDYADETLLWINARTPDQDPIEEMAREYGLTIFSSEENVGIGKALANLVLQAQNPLIIFLEKDWEVVEPRDEVVRQLDYAKRLILSSHNGSRADAVKLRSRWNAGHPNIGKSLCVPPEYDNEELNMHAQFRWFDELNDHQWWLPHLFCNIFHFEKDKTLLDKYPNRIWKCGDSLCFDSAQCGWTNNPILFKKHWFLDTLYKQTQRDDNPTFEGGTYYAKEWLDPHWVIAEPTGFFRHHEINEHM